MDGKISQFLKMQHDLAVEKGWITDRTPENAPFSILWSIDELGEAIAIIKKKGRAQIIVAGSLSHLVASMIIKSIGLYQYYGALVLFRIPLYLCIAPIEILIICALLNFPPLRLEKALPV